MEKPKLLSIFDLKDIEKITDEAQQRTIESFVGLILISIATFFVPTVGLQILFFLFAVLTILTYVHFRTCSVLCVISKKTEASE